MMKKNIVLLLLLSVTITSTVAATTENFKEAYDSFDNTSFWQNALLVAIGSRIHNHTASGLNTAVNYKDPVVMLALSLQIPRDVLGSVLECNKSHMTHMMQAIALAKLSGDTSLKASLQAVFDTAAFNMMNEMAKKYCVGAEKQMVRRVMRVVNMAIIRYAMMLFIQGVIGSARSTGDSETSIAYQN